MNRKERRKANKGKKKSSFTFKLDDITGQKVKKLFQGIKSGEIKDFNQAFVHDPVTGESKPIPAQTTKKGCRELIDPDYGTLVLFNTTDKDITETYLLVEKEGFVGCLNKDFLTKQTLKEAMNCKYHTEIKLEVKANSQKRIEIEEEIAKIKNKGT